ncbi:rhodanese-like domain-containing protein [Deinococcus frigens]|uniref:rhodanese-like domain-containing protein n=1 Tax=Deinococcus frigens TaxID=249403 RepID=UPI0004983E97|nr:rhodanese-like domain-containing protein [Deinococcus frigens]
MPLPEGVTVLDLRPAELRFAQPLEKLTALPVLAVSLQQIEDGVHGLTTETGPLLVICERGVRSGLAAKYLRADGLAVEAYPGGVPALLREVGSG